ncbi:spore cortex biosynthesis protein YabQ [Virgibacillus natechei]|uniref:Spore cortex biosynthesis protein YabQ n=1 Tax=Virgibacillus natechei TaxID=1216297 RepID=A0ABS4IK37_9BACI|nr:spore cortex biosynthesis protein YabQ [Virgibacillus natechei]MBP1970374.1 spore cortex biosynthesis protein YabQ [Virgibacillus natechei]UZD13198.1 spore cortex biosynthesis protein YabQ [Virgibacillus natechei]
MTLSIQFMTMIAMVLSGFYLGIIQETFRRFTLYWEKRVIFSYFMEVCFWLTQTVILFYVLFRLNGGEFRLYIVAAGLLGFAMYQVFAARIYKRILERIIRTTAAIYQFFARMVQAIIITPIQWIVKLLIRSVLVLAGLLGSILLFIGKLIIVPIKWVLQLIYRLLPEKVQNFIFKIAGFYSTMKNIYIKCVKYIKSKRR